MTPKSQIHPPGLVPQILLPSVGADTPVRPPYRRSSIRRDGVLPRPFCRYARHCRGTHSFHPCSVGRAALTPPPFNRTPCKNPVIARPAHTRVSQSASPIHKKSGPSGPDFLEAVGKTLRVFRQSQQAGMPVTSRLVILLFRSQYAWHRRCAGQSPFP